MIFRQWKQVVGLELPLKTQTRRPVKVGDFALHQGPGYRELPIEQVCTARWRLKWQIGRTYMVQRPDKKGVGRITITKIRRERLGVISDDDCIAEGVIVKDLLVKPQSGNAFTATFYHCPICGYSVDAYGWPRDAYACLWEHIYGKGAWDRMKDSPVFALNFELVEGLDD